MENLHKKARIGVIFGGKSSECEQSLNGGRNVYNSLDRTKYEPVAVYWDKKLRFWTIPESLVIRNTTKEVEERLAEKGELVPYEQLKEKIDLAFLVTHGKYGADGVLQGFLELQKIPYTGSGVLASALSVDKAMQRQAIAAHGGVNQPPYFVFDKDAWLKDASQIQSRAEIEFGYPMVTKPTREGSTFGVRLIESASDFYSAVEHALEFDNSVLVEPYLRGREFSCVVMGNDSPHALLPTETIHGAKIFSYDHKYLPGASQKETPMKVDAAVLQEIRQQCERVYTALRMKGYSRIDGFVTDEAKILITDPNAAANCGMAASSWTFHQAAEEGMSTADFLTRAIELAMEAHRDKKGPL